jgi:integrase
LKKITRIAFKEGHADRHYFANYPLLKQKENPPRSLSREEFEKIRDWEFEEHRWSHITTRDLFMFACYTGTAYVDVVAITNDNLSKDDAGDLWLKYQRGKNGKLSRVKLLPEAIELIERYKKNSRETLFPKIEHAALKWNLQSIRQIVGMQGPLTYHMGRHSFSSLIALEGGVPIETLSKMLGHSDIKTTQIYARVTPKKLFEDMDKYIEVTQDLKLVL